MTKPVHHFRSPLAGMLLLLIVSMIPRAEPSSEAADAAANDGERPSSGTYLVRLFVSGARQSELEPCGCIRKQLGGLDREAWLLDDYERKEGPFLKLDAGVLTKGQMNPQVRLKTGYMLRGLAAMGYQALNVGRDEDRLAGKIFDAVFAEAGRNPLVAANVYDARTGQRIYAPHRILEWSDAPAGFAPLRIGVIGLSFGAEYQSLIDMRGQQHFAANPLDRDNLSSDSLVAAREAVGRLRGECDLIVLLAELSQEQLEKIIQQTPGIDLALHTNPANIGRNAVTARKFENTWIVQSGYLGRYLAKIYAYGAPGAGLTELKVKNVEIASDGEKKPELTRLLDEYKAAVAKQFAGEQQQFRSQQQQQPAAPPSRLSFVGARACRMCHQEIHDTWQDSPHAHALETLVQQKQQNNPECLKCHVVGFQTDNGFRTMSSTAYLGGVQCENCHGPGYEHYRFELQELRNRQQAQKTGNAAAAAPAETVAPETRKIRKPVGAEVCTGCHFAPNDNDFVYARDVQWIDHKPDVPDKIYEPHEILEPRGAMLSGGHAPADAEPAH